MKGASAAFALAMSTRLSPSVRCGARLRARIIIALALAALATACATPQTQQPGVAELLERQVRVLSSDDYGGRAPGTVDEEQTLDHLQKSWEAIGLLSGTHDPVSPWRASFTIYPVGKAPVVTHNLIGRIAGTQPHEGAVLVLAHWDHLGRDTPACRPHLFDTVCNGAIDNATGLAMITQIARILAEGPPMARDVYVLATSGEEAGLLGATAFAADPPVPLGKFVAAFNIDSEGLTPTGTVAVMIGDDAGPLAELVRATAAANGVHLADATKANRLYRHRQDGWALERAGLPTVMVSASFADEERLARWMAGSYHRADDEADAVELGGAVRMVALHVALVKAAADPEVYPFEYTSGTQTVPAP
ncbi:M28 family peptidase [Croceicoccus sp. F390]|uniref:M28 family peptidase n=1 Tax=Croceicoccus esteveae TaxID=3075597 RepID=A0ABU2ZF03_9SPHN|nr:M28 family peptidase [Croceicoccus sp. F390]MDT0574879.1 M28 family peptidase [Croceicoccus sp. F390]